MFYLTLFITYKLYDPEVTMMMSSLLGHSLYLRRDVSFKSINTITVLYLFTIIIIYKIFITIILYNTR